MFDKVLEVALRDPRSHKIPILYIIETIIILDDLDLLKEEYDEQFSESIYATIPAEKL